jgi:hypothetical protein
MSNEKILALLSTLGSHQHDVRQLYERSQDIYAQARQLFPRREQPVDHYIALATRLEKYARELQEKAGIGNPQKEVIDLLEAAQFIRDTVQ